MVDVRIMQARKARSHGKITTKNVDFSGDELEPSNDAKTKNSSPRHRRSAKELNKRNLLSKQHQTAETLEWLSENYELIQGVCVPRCVLYTHYLDFCKKRKFSPAGPATFGKLIRQRFPKLTTRRLGTRGQSNEGGKPSKHRREPTKLYLDEQSPPEAPFPRYHYYGISIKESSVYYHSVYSGKGLTRFSSSEGRKKGMTKKFRFDKKGRNTLPEFPKASEMILDRGLSVEKVETFIIMYRTHCQRLLDTVMNANFNEVHKFLLHFWRGMPGHMIPVLECDAVVDIIVVCDSLLYKIFSDVLVPSCIQDIPDSLTEEIQDFAITFVNSLESCLENTPVLLRSKKLQVAKNFVRLLKQNMTFINLAQTARPVFLSYESMSGILNEFRCLDMRKILSELLFLTEQETVDSPVLIMFMEEFENLLVKQAPIEAYAEWFDNIVEEYVLKDEVVNASDISKRSQTFLTNWSFITSRILQELTLKGAPTFASFQLIIMMFEEYILLIIDNQMIAQLDEDLKLGLTRHLRKSGEKEANLAQVGSKTQDKLHKQPQPQKDTGKQKQQHSRQPDQPNQETLTHKTKDQQTLLFQNLQQDIQQLQNSEEKQPQDPYEVQNHSYSHFNQLGIFSQSQANTPQLPNPPPSNSGNNFPIGEVYLGINAVPTDICRIENVRGNWAQNFEYSAQKNRQNTSNSHTGHNNFVGQVYAGSASKDLYDAYQLSQGQGQLGQGQSQLGQGQSQLGQGQDQPSQIHYQVQGQSQYFSRQIEQVLYRSNHQGEAQSSNQDQGHPQGQVYCQDQDFSRDQNLFQNHQDSGQGQHGQGHHGQGHQNQGRSHFKDYQYVNHLQNLDLICRSQKQVRDSVDHNASLLDQNMNYSHASDVCSNYPYTISTSIDSHISQNNSLTYTTHSSCSGQEKTALPSFIQLSSQLSTNTRLSSGY